MVERQIEWQNDHGGRRFQGDHDRSEVLVLGVRRRQLVLPRGPGDHEVGPGLVHSELDVAQGLVGLDHLDIGWAAQGKQDGSAVGLQAPDRTGDRLQRVDVEVDLGHLASDQRQRDRPRIDDRICCKRPGTCVLEVEAGEIERRGVVHRCCRRIGRGDRDAGEFVDAADRGAARSTRHRAGQSHAARRHQGESCIPRDRSPRRLVEEANPHGGELGEGGVDVGDTAARLELGRIGCRWWCRAERFAYVVREIVERDAPGAGDGVGEGELATRVGRRDPSGRCFSAGGGGRVGRLHHVRAVLRWARRLDDDPAADRSRILSR